MTRSISYVVGFFTGLLSVLLIAFLVYWAIKKKTGKNTWEYDERQELARGKGFKAAYFVLLGYLIAYGLFDVGTGIVWCDTFTGIMIGICLSILVFAIICIWKDAYISFRQKPKFYILLFSLLSLLNIGIGLLRGRMEGFVQNGILTMQITNLIVGCILLVVLAVYLCKLAKDKAAEDMCDEES